METAPPASGSGSRPLFRLARTIYLWKAKLCALPSSGLKGEVMRLQTLILLLLALTLTTLTMFSLPAPANAICQPGTCQCICPWDDFCKCYNQKRPGCNYVYNPMVDPDCCIPTSGTCPWLCC